MTEGFWLPRCARPDDLVRPAMVDPAGLTGPTRGQAQGSRWRRSSPAYYVPVDVDADRVEQRILEQGMRVRRRGAVGGWASLRWRGAAYFDGRDGPSGSLRPVPVLRPSGGRRGSESLTGLSRSQLAMAEREFVDGVWCTTVERSLFDEMRFQAPRAAARSLEMTAAAGLVSVAIFAEYVDRRSAWTGVPQVREVVGWCGDDSRSPQETSMKLVWRLDAGLPPPLVNTPLFDLAGNLLGYPDLFDPVAGVVGEYDGADHKGSARHRRDVEREARYRDHGLEYFTVVGGDLQDRDLVVRRMLGTRARARFALPDQRAWTLTPPAWWVPEVPLDDRLRGLGRAADSVR